MNNRPLYISYYTVNTGYELEVQNLISSLTEHDLDYHVSGIKSLGSWQKNTQHKVNFIKECLDRFKRPIVFLDADAVVDQEPILFDVIEEDIAVHYRRITSACRKLLSGTIYMRPTEESYKLLTMWDTLNKTNISELEQVNLALAIANLKPAGLKVKELPASYCNIFDLMNVKDPVITHYQASRRFK